MRILTIADLHTGCIRDTDYFLMTTTDIFDLELNLTHTDMVVILGDYFDRLFKANDEYIALAIDIMSYLTTICRKNHIKLRLIYGTESHEMSQYQIFKAQFGQPDLDMRVIETVTEEEVAPGVTALYLPEEYVDDKARYYERYFNRSSKYDYIFGHGIIEEGWPTPLSDNASIGKEKQVPRFKSKELLGSGKLVLFGHYHCHNEFYLGSLFRWKFGEEQAKGYGIIEDGKLTFVENRKAYRYNTYEYQSDDEIFSGVDSLKTAIDKLKLDNESVFSGEIPGKIKLKLNLPDNLDASFAEVLAGLTVNEKQLAVTTITRSMSLNDEISQSASGEYNFVLDKSLPVADKIYRFTRDNDPDAQVTMEDVQKLVSSVV